MYVTCLVLRHLLGDGEVDVRTEGQPQPDEAPDDVGANARSLQATVPQPRPLILAVQSVRLELLAPAWLSVGWLRVV